MHFIAGIIINFGINNARPLYMFYEKLYLPFNELHLTNQKVTRLSWRDEAAGEGQRRGGRQADVGKADLGDGSGQRLSLRARGTRRADARKVPLGPAGQELA